MSSKHGRLPFATTRYPPESESELYPNRLPGTSDKLPTIEIFHPGHER